MRSALVTRLLGVGLSSAIAAITIALALSGRLALYINPDAAWFAVAMSVVALLGAVASFALPLGAEADHGHDHGLPMPAAGVGAAASRAMDEPGSAVPPHAAGARHATSASAADRAEHAELDADVVPATRRALREARAGAARHSVPVAAVPVPDSGAVHQHPPRRAMSPAVLATATGGVLATGVVVSMLITPPAVLSPQLAMSRGAGATLFADADTVQLAATGDTASFGVGDWSTVFATATDPEAFAGTPVTLTGFVTEADRGFALTRMVVTHCVIDAQPASLPIAADRAPEVGEWVTVTGTVRDVDGVLRIEGDEIEVVDEPKEPYEY
ncbi:DUF1980 domain-containing protein [Microbacterium sp.]|uniref:TIGR03943 family putative permease subunit n=1 Tax=Microbacterium sp. TaxID=51671 RepID=UPI003A87BF07